MRIADYIGEATEYDKKEMLEERRPKSWLKSVSSFANGMGGALIFGVSNESVQADAAALKHLVLRGMNVTYDSIPSPYAINDFSFSKLRSVYRMRTGTELTDSDFISFELANEKGMLTNAGLLLADESPMRHSRLFCTRWYGTDKASGVIDALDDKEYSGSLVSLLQNGIEFIQNNTRKRWKKTGSGRVEMPEYPDQAVQEALVNALIYRDYMDLGSEVHIDIFDDRMEIYSPGGIFDGSIVQNLDTDFVSSKRRNPIIADVFSRMHLMERRGSGFRKIKADYRHAENYRRESEPIFRSTPTSFFVTLFNLNYNDHAEDNEVAIGSEKIAIESGEVAIGGEKVAIEVAIDGLSASSNTIQKARMVFSRMGLDGIFGRSDIAGITNDSVTAAGNLISKLKKEGLIEAVSGYGKGKYRFKMPGQIPAGE